eukprot:12102892-Heterocapsa_arctica.AAC.1
MGWRRAPPDEQYERPPGNFVPPDRTRTNSPMLVVPPRPPSLLLTASPTVHAVPPFEHLRPAPPTPLVPAY